MDEKLENKIQEYRDLIDGFKLKMENRHINIFFFISISQ